LARANRQERIIIQEPTETFGAKRGIATAWSEFSERWAWRKPIGGQERFTEMREHGIRTTVFETRYIGGVNNKMRVLATDVTTTVNEALDNSETEFTVTSATGFPAEPYRAVVDHGTTSAEIVEVTAGQGTTTWTVTRGMDGTSPVAHDDGASIRSLTVHDITAPIDINGRRAVLQLITEDVL
jgi:SPP1 family predicted phage head-tail adaptor